MKVKKLKQGEKTKILILSTGCELWRTQPGKVTASQIAKHCKPEMTPQAISYHFPDGTLRDAVADYAVKIADSYVIVQLIAMKHPAVEKLSARQKAIHIKVVKQPRLI